MKNLDFIQHPGEILREELEKIGITGKKFANIIGKSVSELSGVLNGKRNLTAKWAILLETSLGVSAEFWLGLQKDYDLAFEMKRIRKPNLDLVKQKAKENGIIKNSDFNESKIDLLNVQNKSLA
ncbi:MAG: HigA family addiction module antitoxin [Candidatus Gracilibacteria bacterium]|nr:HigA family addiction module antitoxin [Candidatus Gracilibacteria bacterium]MDQ7023770.1 HigA family addiction module antitoxin [Candidatus Gracilibacteria bacterium]